jgi:hypothetical protein
VDVKELTWGENVAHVGCGTFALVLACGALLQNAHDTGLVGSTRSLDSLWSQSSGALLISLAGNFCIQRTQTAKLVQTEDIIALQRHLKLQADVMYKPKAVEHADVMYIPEAVTPLLSTILDLLWHDGVALVAHGRNCSAEELFCTEAGQRGLSVQHVPRKDMHARYWAPDVTVLKLSRRSCMSGHHA